MVLATEFLRSRTSLTRELSFVVEWLLVAGVMLAVVMLATGLSLRVAMRAAAAPSALPIVQACRSILCYPLVVGLSRLAFGLRKPATGEVDAYREAAVRRTPAKDSETSARASTAAPCCWAARWPR